LVTISMKSLLESGVHFGHQTKRWNPKMKDYIFGERNGIYIIDLQKTLRLFKEAVEFVTQEASQGKRFLFVGTKRQAQDVIAEETKRCGQFYVNQRWLGGLLTNFQTIQKSLKRLKELQEMRTSGHYDLLAKKEVAQHERERKKLEKNLSGIADLDRLPDVIFVVDSNKEGIAIQEARKLGIPIVAIVDTNCDPDQVDYVIPGNDDAMRSIKLITSTVADAILAGAGFFQVQQAEQRQADLEAARQQAASAAESGDDAGGEGAGPGGRPRMAGRRPGPGGRRTIKDRITRPRSTDRSLLAEPVPAAAVPESASPVAAEAPPAPVESPGAVEVVESAPVEAPGAVEAVESVPVVEPPAGTDETAG
jgi:small subunit ribosomal protein S2